MTKPLTGHFNTFSIVARDPETGQIAVAGTTHWFAYATMVPHIQSGAGAIATQAETNVSYGPDGLKLLEQGLPAAEVVSQLTSPDSHKEIRQLLLIDNQGRTAAFTGSGCVKFAGQYTEDNFAVAGNMLATDSVIPKMVEFYNSSDISFAEKVIKTLQIGQQEGGDIRGKRSAGMLVAEAKESGMFWKGIVYNLRTDDNPEPLNELERLHTIATAYQYMNRGDDAFYEHQNNAEALQHYQKAAELFPENPETKFWYAKLLWDMGDKEKARSVMLDVEKSGAHWKEYWERIVGKSSPNT